jgi:large subunit ribosomal protein L10
MAKSKQQKADIIAQYRTLLSDNDGFLAVDTNRLDNITTVELKKALRALDSKFVVVKNTVFKIALQDTDIDPDALTFTGATGIITYKKDPTVVAKAVDEVYKEKEILEARFGYVDGKVIDKDMVEQLAQIPPREVLIAKMLGSLTSPISGFMNVVNGNMRGFIQILSQLSEK